MSEKTLKTLLGMFVGLVGLYGIVALATAWSSSSGDAGGEGPLADALDGLDGATVDAGAAGLVATNPANHARMGVADGGADSDSGAGTGDGAWSITFRSGGAEAEPVRLLVGDAGPTRSSAYVRLPDGDEVYLLEGDLRNLVSHDVDHWRDRDAVADDTAAITEGGARRDGES